MTGALLYLAPVLPARSETFVYYEVFRLRERGLRLPVASLRAPETGLGDARLDALAAEATVVYGRGAAALLRDAALELLLSPTRTLRMALRAVGDAIFGADLRPLDRIKVLAQFLGGLALARRVRPLGICHIHAHFAHAPASIAMYASGQLGVGFSFTGHANDLFQRRSLLPAKLRRARFVACISQWHRAFYGEFARELPDERLPIVRCGVELAAVDSRRDGEAGSPLHVVSVGRLVPKKGFDVLVRALAALKGKIASRCTIIGDGPQRGQLGALLAELGLAGSVTMTGARPHADVLATLATADLFVLPCRTDAAGDRDGIPVVLMEAMAAGVPVIAGDLPAIRELVRHQQTGLLVSPGQAAALAEAMQTLLNDEALRGQLGAQGKAWVAEEFSAVANTQRLLRSFAPVLASPARQVPGAVSESVGELPELTMESLR